MPSQKNEAIARVSAEMAAHIKAARISCEQAVGHIRQSRAAIGRSRDLLDSARDCPTPLVGFALTEKREKKRDAGSGSG